MFTWICPQCGREVPPAYTDCPDCSKKAAANPQPPVAPPGAVTSQEPPPDYTRLQQQYVQPPAQPQPLPPAPYQPSQPPYPQQPPAQPQQQYAPPNYQPMAYAHPAPSRTLPTWLMTVLFAFAFLGLGAGVYWLIGYLRGSSQASTPTSTVESPAAKPGGRASPYQKYIEVSGVRFVENARKKMEVKFVLVNHSPADIAGVNGNVTIWGRTQKSEEEAAGTFTFSSSLGPYESKELTAALTTKLKPIELPDWQNISTDVQITAPGASGDSGGPR
jgi:hypothetical protein